MEKFNTFIDRYSSYSYLVLRVGLGLVFIWFGWSAIMNTDQWVRLVPAWTHSFATAETLVIFHGIVELVFGFLLVAGIWVRIAAGILSLSLLHTVFLVSGPTQIRDIGLLFALISLFLSRKL